MPYRMPDGRIIDNLDMPHAGPGSATYRQMLNPADLQFISQMERFAPMQQAPVPQATGKTTAELAAEQNARNSAIGQMKSMYDAQQANQFSGYFDFLNKPMEIQPFQSQNGMALLSRPTYGGQPPMAGGQQQLSTLYRQGNTYPGMTQQNAQPQVDLGQMYQIFSNPYLAQLASLLFGNSSWLK